MKARDLRDRSTEDLSELERSLTGERFQNKFKNFTNRLDDTSIIRKQKRDLARVKLILTERSRGITVIAKPREEAAVKPKPRAPKPAPAEATAVAAESTTEAAEAPKSTKTKAVAKAQVAKAHKAETKPAAEKKSKAPAAAKPTAKKPKAKEETK